MWPQKSRKRTGSTEHNSTKQEWTKTLYDYLAQVHWLEVECSTEDEIDEATTKLGTIERKLWSIPAPDLTAVLTKLEIAVHECDMPPREATNAITADLRRMSGTATSTIFQADIWLSRWETYGGCYFVRDGEALLCGDPTNVGLRNMTRVMDQANGYECVKAMIGNCTRGLAEGSVE